MSRSGYSDDCDGWALIMWRGAVASATKGARGQAMLRELLAALDAMPVKELIGDSFVQADGQFCALGALGAARGLDMSDAKYWEREEVASKFGIAGALASEIMFMNDDDFSYRSTMEPPAGRWQRMRAWVASQINHVA